MSSAYHQDQPVHKQQKKLEEARTRVQQVFHDYPEVKKLDDAIKDREIRLRSSVLFPLDDHERQELEKEVKAIKKDLEKRLEQLGITPDFKEPQWDCNVCQDRGEVLTQRGFIPCSCRHEEYLTNLRQSSGLPKRFFKATFQSTQMDLYPPESRGGKPSPRARAEKTYEACKRFVRRWVKGDQPGGLFVQGPVGSGKTHLLSCTANALLEEGVSVKFISYSDFLFRLKMSFDPTSPLSEYRIIEEVQKAPVLIIDDLGSEPATDFSSSTFYRIVDRRYVEERPFLVNSTCSPPELQKRLGYLGEKTVKRIMETCDHCLLDGDIRKSILARRRQMYG